MTRGGLPDRQEVYMLKWTHHQQKEISVTTATTTWNLTSWNGTTGTWVTSTLVIVWLTAIPQFDKTSSGTRNYFPNFWIEQYSAVGYCYFMWG